MIIVYKILMKIKFCNYFFRLIVRIKREKKTTNKPIVYHNICIFSLIPGLSVLHFCRELAFTVKNYLCFNRIKGKLVFK